MTVLVALVVLLTGAGLRAHVSSARPLVVAPVRQRRRRARPPDPMVLADHLAALAREVRAGSHLAAARRAVSEPEALATPRWAGHPHVALVRQMVDATADVGGQVAPALDAAAVVLRERAAVAADVQAHSAQARLSARVLTVVPLIFAGWGIVSSTSTRDAYLHSTAGLACALAGGMLNVAGWSWMRRLVRRLA